MQISICESDRSGVRGTAEAAALPFGGEPPLFPPLVELRDVWLSLISEQCFLLDSHYSEEQCFLTLERRPRPLQRRLVSSRVALLERILLGQSQKSVAIDFQLAVSTVALACSDCLRNIGRNHLSSRAPALLVMAAHAAHGLRLPRARAQRIAQGQSECWLIGAPRPDRRLPSELTHAEEAVTRLLVEGHPHARIAALRAASPRTVANQLASAFRKLGISGRAELLANLVHSFAERSNAPSRAPTSAPSNLLQLPAARNRSRGAARRAGMALHGAESGG